MTPLVSQLWPQFMADPDFAACFGRVVVEHAQMLRQERQVIFTLRSGAPLDKNLCARLLASLQPDYEGFELRIQNLFGYAMLDEAALSFLGMGVQPPTASLGNMLNGAQSLTVLTKQPWLWIPPGLLIVVLVIAINFIGDALRDALDPNSRN
mgnify:CR=1 FL=1